MGIPLNLPQRNYIQGFWKLNEESGTRYDESKNHNDLQDINTVLYGTGKIGNAADFELDNSEYLSITDAAQTGLDITGEITICAWVKPESIGINVAIASKYSSSDNKRAYQFTIVDSDNKIYMYLSPDGTAVTSAKSADALSADTWYHVAGTLNQTTDLIQVYIAGLANGDAVSYTTDIYDNVRAFAIGAYDNSTTPYSYFDGLIDEVIVWNKALTAAEVLQVKNITAYKYGGRFLPFFMSMREAYERHNKLWTPKGILIPEGI